MSSIKDRQQRAAARAKLEREMAERSAAARKRRRTLTIAGSGLALLLVVAGTVWLVTALGGDEDETGAQTPVAKPGETICNWQPDSSGGANPAIVDTGTPPPSVPNIGNRVMTIDTNLGPITTALDLTKVPCTAASFEFLAGKNFFNDSKCHRMLTEGIFVLQCGDPSAKGTGWRETDGQGGPSYRYAEENLPVGAETPYPEGIIAMAKTQEKSTTGSQFFIVFKNSPLPPEYTVLGKITGGMDLVKQVEAAGHDNKLAAQGGGGHPKKEVVIKKLTVAAA